MVGMVGVVGVVGDGGWGGWGVGWDALKKKYQGFEVVFWGGDGGSCDEALDVEGVGWGVCRGIEHSVKRWNC